MPDIGSVGVARWAVIVVAAAALLRAAPAAASCEAVAGLSLPDTVIDVAEPVPAGAYTPAGSAALLGLPAFCRVHGTISPVPGSRIGFELWLPQQGWNGRLVMFGNGGYSSAIAWPPPAAPPPGSSPPPRTNNGPT